MIADCVCNGQAAQLLGGKISLHLCDAVGGLKLVAARNGKSRIGISLQHFFNRVIPAAGVPYQHLLKGFLARATYLRIGNVKHGKILIALHGNGCRLAPHAVFRIGIIISFTLLKVGYCHFV